MTDDELREMASRYPSPHSIHPDLTPTSRDVWALLSEVEWLKARLSAMTEDRDVILAYAAMLQSQSTIKATYEPWTPDDAVSWSLRLARGEYYEKVWPHLKALDLGECREAVRRMFDLKEEPS